MIIDVHNHIGLSRAGTLGTVEELTGLMDACRISRAVIFPMDAADPGLTYEKYNDEISAICTRYPERFIGFCRLQPKRGAKAVAEMERCLKMGMKGIKLHPASDSFFIDDCLEVFQAASAAGCPILLHSEHHPTRRPGYWEGAFRKYSGVKFILAHGGMDFFEEAGEVAKQNNNVWLDTSCLSYHRTRALLKIAGPDKILFASDYPFSHPEIEKRKFELLVGDIKELEQIFCLNAKRVLGLS